MIKLLVLFLTWSIASAAPVVGSVTKVRGKATILNLGDKAAKIIKKGMKVRKDASILTQNRSFVRIVLFDKSKITVGPNTKTVIDKVETTKAGLITLLKGRIRSEVKKDGGKRDKLLIKTKTAALGVRGTDFKTTFNPDNGITNLITFRGKVALAKVDAKKIIKKEAIHKVLKKKDIVEVKKGKFATVSKTLKKATEPVKLSPVQFTRLKINKEMHNDAKKIDEKKFKKELAKTIKHYELISKEEKKNKVHAKREYNHSKAKLRPTAGGIIDLGSGIYVPPSMKKEHFNKKLNIYELKEVKGKVSKTGDYTPPEGLKLDSLKGFVAKEEESQKLSKHEVKKLNNEISGHIVKPRKPVASELDSDEYEDSYDKYFRIE